MSANYLFYVMSCSTIKRKEKTRTEIVREYEKCVWLKRRIIFSRETEPYP